MGTIQRCTTSMRGVNLVSGTHRRFASPLVFQFPTISFSPLFHVMKGLQPYSNPCTRSFIVSTFSIYAVSH